MPIAVDVSEAPALLRFTLAGAWPTIEQQRDLRLRLLASAQLTSETRALVDLRGVEDVPDYSQANAIVAASAKDGGLPRVRAYIVSSAAQYSLVRQFKVGAGNAAQIGIFTTEPQALEWLWNLDRHS